MMDGNLTLQAVVSEKANTILKDGNSSMSLFQLYQSVTSVLNQQIQEESFNMSLQKNTRKEVSKTLSCSKMSYNGLHIVLQFLCNKKLTYHHLKSMKVSSF